MTGLWFWVNVIADTALRLTLASHLRSYLNVFTALFPWTQNGETPQPQTFQRSEEFNNWTRKRHWQMLLSNPSVSPVLTVLARGTGSRTGRVTHSDHTAQARWAQSCEVWHHCFWLFAQFSRWFPRQIISDID